MPDRTQRATDRMTMDYPVPILRPATGNGTVAGRPRTRSANDTEPAADNAASTPGQIRAHLRGQHDQKDHGRRKGKPGFEPLGRSRRRGRDGAVEKSPSRRTPKPPEEKGSTPSRREAQPPTQPSLGMSTPRREAIANEVVDMLARMDAEDRLGASARSLETVRDQLSEKDRDEVDATFLEMQRAGLARFVPESNQKTLTDAQRAAAINIGNQDKHLVMLDTDAVGAKRDPLPGFGSERDQGTARRIRDGVPAAGETESEVLTRIERRAGPTEATRVLNKAVELGIVVRRGDRIFRPASARAAVSAAGFDENQLRNEHGRWAETPGGGLGARDELSLASRISLDPGERLTASATTGPLPSNETNVATLAATDGPDGPRIRFAPAIDIEDQNRWGGADLGGTILLDAKGADELDRVLGELQTASQHHEEREEQLEEELADAEDHLRDLQARGVTGDELAKAKREVGLVDQDLESHAKREFAFGRVKSDWGSLIYSGRFDGQSLVRFQLRSHNHFSTPTEVDYDRDDLAAVQTALARVRERVSAAGFDENQLRDEEGQWTKTSGSGASKVAGDKLGLAGKISLGDGETLTGSGRIRGDNADILMAETDGPDGPRMRIAFGMPEDARWRAANGGRTTVLDRDSAAALNSAVEDMRAAEPRIRDRMAELDRQDKELKTRQRELIKAQYPNLTKAQGRKLDKLDEDREEIQSKLASIDSKIQDRVDRLPADERAQYDRAGQAEKDRIIRDWHDSQPQWRGFVAQFHTRDRQSQDRLRQDLDANTEARDELTTNRVPLTPERALELGRVTGEIEDVDRQVIDLIDGQVFESGEIPTEWGAIVYRTEGADEGTARHYIAVRPSNGTVDEDAEWGIELAELDQLQQALEKFARKGASVAAAAEVHSGAMVALVPSAYDAARLAFDGGEPADQLHVTLAYLGKAADIPDEARAAIRAAVREAARWQRPVDADGFSAAAFNPHNADREPCHVLLLGGDDLGQVHEEIVDRIRHAAGAVGWHEMPEQRRPWQPHITLEYTDDLDRLKAVADRTGTVRLDRLRVAFAGEIVDFPLGGGALAAAAPDVGDDNQLKRYWLAGEGLAKWTSWTDLYQHLREHMVDERAKRIAAAWFHERYGFWPGDRRNASGGAMPNPQPSKADRITKAWNERAPFSQHIVEVHAAHVIVTDEADRSFWRVPVSLDADKVTFGEPVRQMPAYVDFNPDVAAGAVVYASRAESRPDIAAGIDGDDVAAHLPGRHDQSAHGRRFNRPGDPSSGVRPSRPPRGGSRSRRRPRSETLRMPAEVAGAFAVVNASDRLDEAVMAGDDRAQAEREWATTVETTADHDADQYADNVVSELPGAAREAAQTDPEMLAAIKDLRAAARAVRRSHTYDNRSDSDDEERRVRAARESGPVKAEAEARATIDRLSMERARRAQDASTRIRANKGSADALVDELPPGPVVGNVRTLSGFDIPPVDPWLTGDERRHAEEARRQRVEDATYQEVAAGFTARAQHSFDATDQRAAGAQALAALAQARAEAKVEAAAAREKSTAAREAAKAAAAAQDAARTKRLRAEQREIEATLKQVTADVGELDDTDGPREAAVADVRAELGLPSDAELKRMRLNGDSAERARAIAAAEVIRRAEDTAIVEANNANWRRQISAVEARLAKGNLMPATEQRLRTIRRAGLRHLATDDRSAELLAEARRRWLESEVTAAAGGEVANAVLDPWRVITPAQAIQDVLDEAIVAAAAISDKPWSDFTQADYTPEQWRRACLVDTGDGVPDAKSRFKLPVREPDGTLNRNGVHAAASRFSSVEDASDEAMRTAARKLAAAYRQLGEDPPPSVADMVAAAAENQPATPATDVPAAEPEPTHHTEEDPVSDLSEVSSRLGLAPEADETAVLAAIDALKAKADETTTNKEAEVAAAAAATAERDELKKEVQVLATQVKDMSSKLAAAEQEKAATVKASVIDGAIKAGKIKPADREQWETDYDEAPAAITRVLASIAAGTAVPVQMAGEVGDEPIAAAAGDLTDAELASIFPPGEFADATAGKDR